MTESQILHFGRWLSKYAESDPLQLDPERFPDARLIMDNVRDLLAVVARHYGDEMLPLKLSFWQPDGTHGEPFDLPAISQWQAEQRKPSDERRYLTFDHKGKTYDVGGPWHDWERGCRYLLLTPRPQ